jgi:hypothetical protein
MVFFAFLMCQARWKLFVSPLPFDKLRVRVYEFAAKYLSPPPKPELHSLPSTPTKPRIMGRMSGRGGGVLWVKHGALLGDEPPHWSPTALEAGGYVIQWKARTRASHRRGAGFASHNYYIEA